MILEGKNIMIREKFVKLAHIYAIYLNGRSVNH